MHIRKIIHIDMDAFFAAVEQREDPDLKGKPVIVGGSAEERGVVSTCSYEARKFGIHSAMSTAKALKLCPQAILVYPHFEIYSKVSEDINTIFHEYTDLVEPLSLDEAYLDVTENKASIASATRIAFEIKEKILMKTKLTASAGVSYNKFRAKTASGYKKPDGLTVVTPENAERFISALPIGSFYGVGKVTEKRMLELGIKNGADLKKWGLEDLINNFGKSGDWFYQLARGIDESLVEPYHERQSFGREITLLKDITDMDQIIKILSELAGEVEKILKEYETAGRTITLKVKYFDFKQSTRSITLTNPIQSSNLIMKQVKILLLKTMAGEKKIRLLGIQVSHFKENYRKNNSIQLELPFLS